MKEHTRYWLVVLFLFLVTVYGCQPNSTSIPTEFTQTPTLYATAPATSTSLPIPTRTLTRVPATNGDTLIADFQVNIRDLADKMQMFGQLNKEVTNDISLLTSPGWYDQADKILNELERSAGELGTLSSNDQKYNQLIALIDKISSEVFAMTRDYRTAIKNIDSASLYLADSHLQNITQYTKMAYDEIERISSETSAPTPTRPIVSSTTIIPMTALAKQANQVATSRGFEIIGSACPQGISCVRYISQEPYMILLVRNDGVLWFTIWDETHSLLNYVKPLGATPPYDLEITWYGDVLDDIYRSFSPSFRIHAISVMDGVLQLGNYRTQDPYGYVIEGVQSVDQKMVLIVTPP